MRKLFTVLILSLLVGVCHAQGYDGVRAGLFLTNAKLAQKVILAQDAVTTVHAGEHIVYKNETNKIVNFQKQFDDYISSFKDVLAYAAEFYGLYYEVKNTIDGLNRFKRVSQHVVQHQTTNLVAVAYSEQGKYLYKNIVETGLQVAKDIKLLMPFGKNKSKMTEMERIECLSKIRLNIRKVNQQIWKAANLLKYTTLFDTWYEITQSTKPVKSTRPMADIVKDARAAWVRHAEGANKFNSN